MMSKQDALRALRAGDDRNSTILRELIAQFRRGYQNTVIETPALKKIIADQIIAMSSVSPTNDPLDPAFTGVVMTGDPITISGTDYNLFGLLNGVLQWGASTTNASLVAGGGVVVVDADGITIEAATTYENKRALTFKDDTGDILGGIYALEDIGGAGGGHSIDVRAVTANSEDSTASLIAEALAADLSTAQIRASASDDALNFAFVQVFAGTSKGVSIQGGTTITAKIGTISILDATASEICFNNDGEDVNFRVGGDGDANLFVIDASADRVGIGTSSPATKLDVNGTVTATGFSGPLQLIPPVIKSGNYTLQASEHGAVVVFTATATATLPNDPPLGTTYRICCRAGTLTIDGDGSDTIKGELTQTITASGNDLIITYTEPGVWE